MMLLIKCLCAKDARKSLSFPPTSSYDFPAVFKWSPLNLDKTSTLLVFQQPPLLCALFVSSLWRSLVRSRRSSRWLGSTSARLSQRWSPWWSAADTWRTSKQNATERWRKQAESCRHATSSSHRCRYKVMNQLLFVTEETKNIRMRKEETQA